MTDATMWVMFGTVLGLIGLCAVLASAAFTAQREEAGQRSRAEAAEAELRRCVVHPTGPPADDSTAGKP